MSMQSQETGYLAYFSPVGYYAQHQPRYEWSFTHDIEKALFYKTEEGAKERVEQGISVARSKIRLNQAYDNKIETITEGKVIVVIREISIAAAHPAIPVQEPPKPKIVSDALLQAIEKRIDEAKAQNKFSINLNSLNDDGANVRGVGMYLSPIVYAEVCRIYKDEYGVGIKVEGDIHKIWWTKFNL